MIWYIDLQLLTNQVNFGGQFFNGSHYAIGAVIALHHFFYQLVIMLRVLKTVYDPAVVFAEIIFDNGLFKALASLGYDRQAVGYR